jgi:hypothetical protein
VALTMARTRTQTTLTRLAELLANLNGELEFVARLVHENPGHQDLLRARQHALQTDREAVRVTLSQSDPTTNVLGVGTLDEWMRSYGRPGRQLQARYLARLQINVQIGR